MLQVSFYCWPNYSGTGGETRREVFWTGWDAATYDGVAIELELVLIAAEPTKFDDDKLAAVTREFKKGGEEELLWAAKAWVSVGATFY